MDFFDILDISIPVALYNYKELKIFEPEEKIIFVGHNSSDNMIIRRVGNNVALTKAHAINQSKYIHIIINKKMDQVSFSDILECAHSFKNVRHHENIQALDACIGLMLIHNVHDIFFSVESYESIPQSNIFDLQDLYPDIYFDKMNNALSMIYCISSKIGLLTNIIIKSINPHLLTNHIKMKFLCKFEKYCLQNLR